jgi:hypothetical protein
MTDLVERWPAETAQLVLASRVDPPLRLHRLRLSGELCELRDRDLYLSLAESSAMLANFGVQVGAGELALLHRRSEGWAAALQMAALMLRGTKDPAQVARALDIRSHAIAEYFISFGIAAGQSPNTSRTPTVATRRAVGGGSPASSWRTRSSNSPRKDDAGGCCSLHSSVI